MWIYRDAQIVGCISQKHCLTSLTVKLWRDGNLTGLPFPVLDVLISAWSTRMQESYKSSPNRPANRKEKLTPLFSDQKAQEVRWRFWTKTSDYFSFQEAFQWGRKMRWFPKTCNHCHLAVPITDKPFKNSKCYQSKISKILSSKQCCCYLFLCINIYLPLLSLKGSNKQTNRSTLCTLQKSKRISGWDLMAF